MLDWAKAAGFRSGDNPVEGVTKGLPKQSDEPDHHAALPYVDVPQFIEKLHASSSAEIVRLAFEFLILTATRTNEVLGATWGEIDLSQQLWTIPAKRMKGGREHRVPLAPRCLEIIGRAKELGCGSDYLFPSRSPARPLSNMAFLMALRGMHVQVTAHGFRSAFRDWAAEQTSHPHDVCEMALAHSIPNRVEAAYRRGDLLEKRRELMDEWYRFVTVASPAGT